MKVKKTTEKKLKTNNVNSESAQPATSATAAAAVAAEPLEKFSTKVTVTCDEHEIVITTRVQLLWMDFSTARAYYKRYVEPILRRTISSATKFRLFSISVLRLNYQERVVTYKLLSVSSSSSSSSPPSDLLGNAVCEYHLNDVELLDAESRSLRTGTILPPPMSMAERFEVLSDALFSHEVRKKKSKTELIDSITCFDFWESDVAWWRDRVSAYWFDHPYRRNNRRVVHLLNQLTRLLRQLYRLDLASVFVVLRSLSHAQIDLLDRIFVEPINGTLLASHLATLFMHGKQQTGLNMKHEANKQLTLTLHHLQSDRDFDAKLYLKMSTSCVRRDIFELMVRINLLSHNGGGCDSGVVDDSQRSNFLLCNCTDCRALRDFANAWRYYDCRDRAMVRFEFPRKTYQSVCTILQRQHDCMQLVYTSDKNEFYNKVLFIDNFVNYYAFYENDQHPLVVSQCTDRMRNIVSALYVFAVVNWKMIEDNRKHTRNLSISLNQQSLCKSLNNTLYSIFSENCISQVSAETKNRLVSENAAYINRGLGVVPNTAINAFQTSHVIRVVE